MASNPSSSNLLQLARQWAGQAVESGWLNPSELQRLEQLQTATPEDLFTSGGRPLVVAFFGGTGVGKSTLLNRLAGEPVAKTGVERPTSREVTLFAHESVQIQRLPSEMPLERVKTARHRNHNRKDILWIDMPDIDSIEHANRELALAWLPHIDVLIYVVSPERYRDDKGWEILLENARDHAWLFVMNHWDQGVEEQIDDFASQLKQAGFQNPIILRCDSREDLTARKPDDFGKLEEILSALANAHTISQLQSRGEEAHRQALKQILRETLTALGDNQAFQTLINRWRDRWQHTLKELEPGLQWPMQALAREVTANGQKRLKRSKADPSEDHGNTPLSETLMMDVWVQKRLEDTLNQAGLEAESLSLPPQAIRRALQAYKPKLADTLVDKTQRSLRLALANPGNRLQRFVLKLTGILRILLPLAASGWAGYQVVMRYYQGYLGQGEYLGLDFAIHSGLLIFLSWIIPHLLHRALQPSLEKTALRGLKNGLEAGFEQIESDIVQILENLEQQHQQTLHQVQELMENIDQNAAPASQAALDNRYLKRMVVAK